MKPELKAPGDNCLPLKHDKLLSSFAFKFNLRRYHAEDSIPSQKIVQRMLQRAGVQCTVVDNGEASQILLATSCDAI
jgi:hypothetical protein